MLGIEGGIEGGSIEGGGGGGDLPDTSMSATVPGQLSADPAVARWTPVHLEFSAAANYNVVIVVKIGVDSSLWLTAYDEKISGTQGQDALSPVFSGKSVANVVGDFGTPRVFSMDILPNGGWQRPEVTVVPYIALEMAIPDVGGGT